MDFTLDNLFKPPPPTTDNDRICDHNAMLAFQQEKIPHYNSGEEGGGAGGGSKLENQV